MGRTSSGPRPNAAFKDILAKGIAAAMTTVTIEDEVHVDASPLELWER
jgi:hypothetical protein